MDRDLEDCKTLSEYDRERERHELDTLQFHAYAHADSPRTIAHRCRMNTPDPRQIRVMIGDEQWLLFAYWNSTGGKEYFLARNRDEAAYILGGRGASPNPCPVLVSKWSKQQS